MPAAQSRSSARDGRVAESIRGIVAQISGTTIWRWLDADAIRPWQHVLEPLHGYMRLAEELLAGAPSAARFANAYNFGPNEEDARPVSWIAEQMTNFWGDGASWVLDDDHGPHDR